MLKTNNIDFDAQSVVPESANGGGTSDGPNPQYEAEIKELRIDRAKI